MHSQINEILPCFIQVKEELSSVGVKFLAHNLKVIKSDTNLDLSCSICFEYFTDNSKVSKLKCRHVYHSDCLDQLLIRGKNKRCPICRAGIKIISKQDSPMSLINNLALKCIEDRCFYFSSLNRMYDFYLMTSEITDCFSELFKNSKYVKLNKLSIIKKAYAIFNKGGSKLSVPHIKKPEDDTQQAILCPYPEKLFKGSSLETFFDLHSSFLCSYIINNLVYYLPNISILKTGVDLDRKSISIKLLHNETKSFEVAYLWSMLSERCKTAMFLMHSISKRIMNDVIMIKLIIKYSFLTDSNSDLKILYANNNGVLSFDYLNREGTIDIYMSDFVDYNTLEINYSRFKSMLYLQGIDIDAEVAY